MRRRPPHAVQETTDEKDDVRIFGDSVEPADADSESAVVFIRDLIPTAACVAAEFARHVETAERAAADVVLKAVEQQRAAARETTLALAQESVRTAGEMQERLREVRDQEHREMRATFRAFRRSALLRHSVARRTQGCRWSRPRATVSVRAHGRPRRRAAASRDRPGRDPPKPDPLVLRVRR